VHPAEIGLFVIILVNILMTTKCSNCNMVSKILNKGFKCTLAADYNSNRFTVSNKTIYRFIVSVLIPYLQKITIVAVLLFSRTT